MYAVFKVAVIPTYIFGLFLQQIQELEATLYNALQQDKVL